jgi:hypothetical protein
VAWKFGLKLIYKYSYKSSMKWHLYVILYGFYGLQRKSLKYAALLAGLLHSSG